MAKLSAAQQKERRDLAETVLCYTLTGKDPSFMDAKYIKLHVQKSFEIADTFLAEIAAQEKGSS